MAADQDGWQSYNFPFSVQEIVSQSFIDYSSASVLNIDLDGHDKTLVMYPKKSHCSRLQRLVAKHQSLPFLVPNSLPMETMNDCHLSGTSREDKGSTTHLRNFSTYHPDIMYGTIAELLQGEMNCYPWSTCGNVRHYIDISLPWKRKQKLCTMCSKIREASPDLGDSCAQAMMKHLATSLPDISPSLLENLLQESISSEISRVPFDTFMGNSLACYALDAEQQAVLMYPSGVGLDVLNFSNIPQVTESTDIVDNTSFPDEPIFSTQQFSVQGQIRQIDFSCYSGKDIVVGTRAQYNCSFFQSFPNDSTDGQVLSIKSLETVALTKQAMCITVSPYIPGEGVIVTETGGVYLWKCGQGLTTVCPAEQFEYTSDPAWYHCVFAANPVCIAMANLKSVDLMDFRAGRLFQRFFFSIPSAQVDSFECISSIQRHPQNCHNYFLATEQSLMILDDRFLQHPVLKWRHHNEDAVQFIHVACDAIPECDDTVLLTSGSNHHQTHCFQYSRGQSYLPPQSIPLPWKVSSYSEWYHSGLREDITFSQATASRLSQPLIGLCTMPHASHPCKGFTVFQMSSAGDLFYQPFFAQNSRGSEEGQLGIKQEQALGSKEKMLCQKWIDMIDGGMDNPKETRICQVDIFEEDKRDVSLALLLLPAPHPDCVLCNDSQLGELHSPEGDSSICDRCGSNITYSRRLVELQERNRVVTTSSFGIQHEVNELEIKLDFNKATDPLSKSLWLNWHSDEAIPVALNDQGWTPEDSISGSMEVPMAKSIVMNSDKQSQGFSEGPMQVNSNKTKTVNSEKPVVLSVTNTSRPVKGDKPVLATSSNRTVPLKKEELLPEILPKEEGLKNTKLEERSKGNGKMPKQYLSLSPARKTLTNCSPSKRVVNSPLQNQAGKSSSKKKKLSDRVMGF